MTDDSAHNAKEDRHRAGPQPPGTELRLQRVRQPRPELLALLAAYDEEAFGAVGLRACDLAVMAEVGAVFVARQGEEIVGACQLLRSLEEPEFFYLVGFYLRPGWRSQGFGRRFLELVSQESQRLGAQGLLLTVAPDNARAFALYRRCGFAVERFVPDFYGPGEDRYLLRRRFQGGVDEQCMIEDPGRR